MFFCTRWKWYQWQISKWKMCQWSNDLRVERVDGKMYKWQLYEWSFVSRGKCTSGKLEGQLYQWQNHHEILSISQNNYVLIKLICYLIQMVQ
jgi:hypothetical protein